MNSNHNQKSSRQSSVKSNLINGRKKHAVYDTPILKTTAHKPTTHSKFLNNDTKANKCYPPNVEELNPFMANTNCGKTDNLNTLGYMPSYLQICNVPTLSNAGYYSKSKTASFVNNKNGTTSMFSTLKTLIKSHKKKDIDKFDKIMSFYSQQPINSATLEKQAQNVETKSKLLQGMLNPFNKKDEKIVKAIKNKNLSKVLKEFEDYDFAKQREFWKEVQITRMNINEKFSSKPNYAGIIVGMLLGVGAFGAFNFMEALKNNKHKLTLMYACIFKNAIGVIPNPSMNILFDCNIFQLVSNVGDKPEYEFVTEILQAEKKIEYVFQKVDVIYDAVNLHNLVESQKLKAVVDYFMVESNRKIADVSKYYYSNYGITIIEHLAMYECNRLYLVYLKYTISCAISRSVYFAFTLGEFLESKKSYNDHIYIIICILELGQVWAFDKYEEFYKVRLRIQLKEYLSTSLQNIVIPRLPPSSN